MFRKENRKTSPFAATARLVLAVGVVFAVLAAPAFGQHVHQLFYDDNAWADTDLTAAGGGLNARAYSLAAFYTQGDQLHVYYVSEYELHIHQLYNNGTSWTDEDLTTLTGGMTALSAQISGFQIGGAQYLYFCGNDNVVHEYTYGNNGDFNWVDNALPTGNTQGSCGGDVVAVVTSPNNQRHVYYTAQSSTETAPLRQLYFNGFTWQNQAFSSLLEGAKKAQVGSWLSAFAVNNDQYVFFQGPGQTLYMYSYVDNWAITNITDAAGAPKMGARLNGVAAFAVPGTSQMEVYYAAAKTNDVQQATFVNGAWTDEDLTAQAGGSGPVEFSQITALSTPGNFHVYLTEDHDVFQLYFNGSDWANQGLPSASATVTATASFAIGNDQYVYYISGVN